VRPVALVLLLAALAAGIWLGLRAHAARHVTLAFVGIGDAPPPPLELTFFPQRLAFAAPSPPPPLGRREVPAGELTVGAEAVPGQAVVRYRGPGVGTGYAHVELGRTLAPIRLRAPIVLTGRVGEPIAFWCFGWRCAGLRPVAGAEVLVMGGGEHGIELASGATDADGRFTIEGVDGALDGIALRVRARGFALAHEALARRAPTGSPTSSPTGSPDAAPTTVIALAPASTIRGRIAAPAAIDRTTLRVLARGLPGVHTMPAADGTFVLDHVPVDVAPRLLVLGLPDTWTHLPARGTTGAPVRIDVVPGAAVRGRVLDAGTRAPLAHALVFCGDQDAVRADDDGRYELLRQLPGDVEVAAQWQPEGKPRSPIRHGRTRVVLEPNDSRDGVDILVSAR
jgi:hypothetical protein